MRVEVPGITAGAAPHEAHATRAADFAASYAIAGGATTLLGWALDLPPLTDWEGDGISQMPNSALGVVLCGVALMLIARGRRTLAGVLAAVAAFIGAATLSQYLFGWDLGIDRLLFPRDWGQKGAFVPGRMGPPSATSLALVGTATALLALARTSRLAVVAGIATVAIASLSIVGYLFGADRLYTVPKLTVIASQTSTMLFALGVALVMSVPDRQPARTLRERSAAGLLLRRAGPVLAGATLLAGGLEVAALRAGLFDPAFGNALLVLALLAVFTLALWWAAASLSVYEREANANRDRLVGVLESVADAVVIVDAGWRVRFANEAVRRRAGAPEGVPLVGRTLFEVLPETAGPAWAPLREVLATRTAANYEAWSERGARWYADRAYPTQDGGLALFSRDVTARRRDEEELRRLAADLRETDRRKDEFLATLAHELRNPLAPIRNSVEILKRAGDSPTVVAGARATMERQLVHLVRLIDDLLDVSRISRDKLELRRERVELADVLRHAVETSAPLVEARRHALELDVPDVRIPLDADPVRLAQVFANLLSNACRYTEPGGSIRVRVSLEGGAAVVSVRDTGVGIPPAMLPRVFEMFVQLDRRLERSQGGLGLGLTLVKRLVELHGGHVTAHSEGPGSGSEFVVRLPLAGAEPAAEAPAVEAQTTRE